MSPKNPGKEEKEDPNVGKIHATFVNSGKDPVFKDATIFFQDTKWADFSHGDPAVAVNTFEGHQWNIKRNSDGELLKQITIKKGKAKQTHEV